MLSSEHDHVDSITYSSLPKMEGDGEGILHHSTTPGKTPGADLTTTFNALWERYRVQIFTRLLDLVHNRESAEDLLQETYLRAWRALPSLKSEENLFGWLYQIASRLAINWYRKQHGTGKTRHNTCSLDLEDSDGYPLLDLEDATYDPERAACEKDIRVQALARLNPEGRARLVSHFIHNEQVEAHLLWNDRHRLNEILLRVERGSLPVGPKPGKGKRGGQAA